MQVARDEETIRFLVFKWVFTRAFRSYFPMFSQMLFLLVKKMEILFYSVSFCLPKSITNSLNLILLIQFSWLLWQGITDGSQAISCR